jgi:hypothetical protein
MKIKINEPVENVKISLKGRSVTIIYKNGERWVENFENYLKVFHDAEKAKNEYLLKLWYILGTYTDLSDEKVNEIVKTVREKLEKTQ